MEKKEFTDSRRKVTFVDLFAGAGGISEGFMQAYTEDKYFDFRLASDINENCELTHRARYNNVLGLDTEFICQDIMEDSFLPNLLNKLKGQEIEVVTGGPSCQSFSLAGRRKKLDKRDDLFFHYLKVIFVFQGKRQTGGNNRQKEIPQYTLVGNAVPPLMARAIANTLLKHIK